MYRVVANYTEGPIPGKWYLHLQEPSPCGAEDEFAPPVNVRGWDEWVLFRPAAESTNPMRMNLRDALRFQEYLSPFMSTSPGLAGTIELEPVE